MINRKSQSSIICIFLKMNNNKSFIRITVDFVLRLASLFHSKNKRDMNDTNKIIRSIQDKLFANIGGFIENGKLTEISDLEIFFESQGDTLCTKIKNLKTRKDNLINVVFKKICWDEINEFRVFLLKYMEIYFNEINSGYFKGETSMKKAVSDLSYVVQEILQNANEHSPPDCEYELYIRHKGDDFHIIVYNFAEKSKASHLIEIVNEVKNTKNLSELLLEYMINNDKHLGIISSIANYNIREYNVFYSPEEIISVEMIMKIER